MRGGSIFDSPELRHLWNKARAALTKDPPPEDPKKTLTLEVRPEEVKVLYARALALQSLVDGWLGPREIEYLYVFMSRVSMSSDSREEVRQTLATREASPEDVVRLVEELISAVPDNQEEISVSIIKDMVHLSHADNVVCLSGKRRYRGRGQGTLRRARPEGHRLGREDREVRESPHRRKG